MRCIYYFIVFSLSVITMGCGQQNKTYQWPIPKDFPKPQVPLDNPMTVEKVQLGRFLFYDKNLSANQTQNCASCHMQKNAFAEPLKVSVGSTGEPHRRNSLALVNIAYNKTLTWAHPSLGSIERQVLLPMFGESPVELGITGNETTILARFNTTEYKKLFKAAFDDAEINFDNINKALSSFVRRLISFTSPFDQYAYGMDDNALTASQIRGMDLFFSERLECHHCHGGFNFTQSTSHEKQVLDRRPFHNTGLYNIDGKGAYPEKDTGLDEITFEYRDIGSFRAPTLRNVALTAPYMHDGSIATLSDVLDHYAAGGRVIDKGENAGNGIKSPLKSQFINGFEMNPQDKADLIAFLTALTDEKFINDPELSNPFTQ